MGAVYLARDVKLDRLVALKVLPPEFAGDSALRERFLRETRTAASFSHPNIVPVHAVEDRDGVLAFAMGFVEGESLAQRVRRAGPLDTRALVRLLQDVGYALAYAHGRGVVHRDIKPDNIMLERATGRALLMDFGIARAMKAPVSATQGLTRVGEVVGTPEYMSPEQASGDDVDGRSDLYSLGLVTLFALTGKPAITGANTQQILVKQLTELPPPAVALRPGLPAALGAAIDRCVAKTPSDRFERAESLVEAIDDAQLAAPEIPLPVRMFSQEAGTLGLVMFFLMLITPLLVSAMSTGGDGDAIIPVVILFAVGFTRVMQTSSAARRLALLGFGPADVVKGMRAVLDEREGVREQLRSDPDTQRRRRTTLIVAGLMIVGAVAMFAIGISGRVETGPGRYKVSFGGLAMLVSAVTMLCVSFVLIVRSPFRATLGERLFGLLWLGPIGRWFLRFSARGVALGAAAAAASGAVKTVTPAPARTADAPSTSSDDRLAALEARLAALEKGRGSPS